MELIAPKRTKDMDRQRTDWQEGDVLTTDANGALVLVRSGAPVRQVELSMEVTGSGDPVMYLLVPKTPPLTPDQRDALTALRDTLAADAEAMVMAPDAQTRAIGEYAGQVVAALNRALGCP